MKRIWNTGFFAVVLLVGCRITPEATREHALRQRLDSTMIAEVDFRMAQPECVVAFLQAESAANAACQPINILLIPPHPEYPDGITFQATNISLREALNILRDVSGLSWSIEDSCVKVRQIQQKVQH